MIEAASITADLVVLDSQLTPSTILTVVMAPCTISFIGIHARLLKQNRKKWLESKNFVCLLFDYAKRHQIKVFLILVEGDM